MMEDEATERKRRRPGGEIDGDVVIGHFYYDRGRGNCNCINVLF
jgi:hypothetical protein